MMDKITRWLEYLAGWLLSLFWQHVETNANKEIKQQMNLHISPGNMAVHIPGFGKVPVETFQNITTQIIPHVVEGMKRGDAAKVIYETIAANAAPAVLSTAETLLGVLFPAAGTILGLLVWMIENSKPMTQEETNAWMDRFGAGSQS